MTQSPKMLECTVHKEDEILPALLETSLITLLISYRVYNRSLFRFQKDRFDPPKTVFYVLNYHYVYTAT